MQKRVAIAFLATGLALGAFGCGTKENDPTPAACLLSSNSYLQALKSAPAPVRLAEDTPISDCLVATQSAGELASTGHEMIIAATRLNAEARRDPGGPAALQLGYLSGAVAKGADSIHTDLVRRLNSAAQFTQGGGTPPAAFAREFARGYAAGRSSG